LRVAAGCVSRRRFAHCQPASRVCVFDLVAGVAGDGSEAAGAAEQGAGLSAGLAAGFLARFGEASDDFGLYGVVDFYLSYRAWVRGKVACAALGRLRKQAFTPPIYRLIRGRISGGRTAHL
jgi:hypothetical protein